MISEFHKLSDLAPQAGEKYYFLRPHPEYIEVVPRVGWYGDIGDYYLLMTGNVYKTEEEAVKAAKEYERVWKLLKRIEKMKGGYKV